MPTLHLTITAAVTPVVAVVAVAAAPTTAAIPYANNTITPKPSTPRIRHSAQSDEQTWLLVFGGVREQDVVDQVLMVNV